MPIALIGHGSHLDQRRTELLTPFASRPGGAEFSAYATQFMETYVLANDKPSERSTKTCILKHHLLPLFGEYYSANALRAIRRDPHP